MLMVFDCVDYIHNNNTYTCIICDYDGIYIYLNLWYHFQDSAEGMYPVIHFLTISIRTVTQTYH